MNKNKQILKILSIVVFSAILFVACSKARIEGPIDAGTVDETDNQTGANKLHFVSLTDYYKTKQQKKEEISRNFFSTTPAYETVYGSRIWTSANFFLNNNGNIVEEPVKCHIIELYKIKQYIFFDIQTVSNNKLLITNSVCNLNCYKDTNLLILNKNGYMNFGSINSLGNTHPLNLYGFNPKMQNKLDSWSKLYNYTEIGYDINLFNFVDIPNGKIGFSGRVGSIGWYLMGDYAQFNTTEYTNLTFTSTNADLTNVGIYICFSDINSYTKVEDCTSILLPVGEYVKVLAVGITKNNELYYNLKKIVIDKNKTNYDINMKPTTDELLTQILDSL